MFCSSILILFKCLPRNGTVGSYGSSIFSCFEELPYCFPLWLHQSKHLHCTSSLFTIPSLLLFISCLLDGSHSDSCEVVSNRGFDLLFPDDRWCWISFHVCVSHLYIFNGKMPIVVPFPVFNWIFILSCIMSTSIFTSPFPIWLPFTVCFPFLIAVAKISSTMLNKSDCSEHPCFVPVLRGKTFNLILSIMVAVNLSHESKSISRSVVSDSATPSTADYQAPLSIGFYR